MYGMPSLAVCSFSFPATSRHSCSLSSVSGPAMRNSGLSRPTSKPQRRIGQLSCDDPELGGGAVSQRRADECLEQRMAVARCRGELRVELHAHEERMPGQLHDLGQALARRARRDFVALHLELRHVDIVHLIPVPMPLVYFTPID